MEARSRSVMIGQPRACREGTPPGPGGLPRARDGPADREVEDEAERSGVTGSPGRDVRSLEGRRLTPTRACSSSPGYRMLPGVPAAGSVGSARVQPGTTTLREQGGTGGQVGTKVEKPGRFPARVASRSGRRSVHARSKENPMRHVTTGLVGLCSIVLVATPRTAQQAETLHPVKVTRPSVSSSGAQSNALSSDSLISADGRYVAFSSD